MDASPPPKSSRNRLRPTGCASIFIFFVVVGAGILGYRHITVDKESSNDIASPLTIPAATVPIVTAPPVPFLVQTEAFSFTMPATPLVEPVEMDVAGVHATGTDWLVEIGKTNLDVLAMTWGIPLEEANAQGGFDGMINGMVRRGNGTIVSDTWSYADGLYVRDTVISLAGGQITMRGYAKGVWMVAILGTNPVPEVPAGFPELVASFSFV